MSKIANLREILRSKMIHSKILQPKILHSKTLNWLHRCWWRILETKCVGDNYATLVTVLTRLDTNIKNMSSTFTNRQNLYVANITVIRWHHREWLQLCWWQCNVGVIIHNDRWWVRIRPRILDFKLGQRMRDLNHTWLLLIRYPTLEPSIPPDWNVPNFELEHFVQT